MRRDCAGSCISSPDSASPKYEKKNETEEEVLPASNGSVGIHTIEGMTKGHRSKERSLGRKSCKYDNAFLEVRNEKGER